MRMRLFIFRGLPAVLGFWGRTAVLRFLGVGTVLRLLGLPAVLCLLGLTVGCTPEQAQPLRLTHHLHIAAAGSADDHDPESLIWDINLYLAEDDGSITKHQYIVAGGVSDKSIKLDILRGERFSIHIMANAGFDLGDMSRQELAQYRYHLRYPDNFEHGMPMSGVLEGIAPDSESASLRVPLERLFAKICLRMDTSQLDEGVNMSIFSTRIGNCPRSVRVFAESAAQSPEDLFPTGYTSTFSGNDFTVYCLENCQHHPSRQLGSYIELDIDYSSGSYESPPGRGLVYRFYLRENDDFCVRRNNLYNITVIPTGSGILSDDSWRVDTSSLRERPCRQQSRRIF